jgi:hypothetical protein
MHVFHAFILEKIWFGNPTNFFRDKCNGPVAVPWRGAEVRVVAASRALFRSAHLGLCVTQPQKKKLRCFMQRLHDSDCG